MVAWKTGIFRKESLVVYSSFLQPKLWYFARNFVLSIILIDDRIDVKICFYSEWNHCIELGIMDVPVESAQKT
jgi:hypothetical protein